MPKPRDCTDAARLLVSVRSVSEAVAAVAGGADIVDLKEPSLGSLGPVDADTVTAVAEAIGANDDGPPLSLAMGELLQPDSRRLAMLTCMGSDFSYAKIGLAGTAQSSTWRSDWRAWSNRLPVGVQAVFVIYLDWQSALTCPPSELLPFAMQLANERRVAGILFDTCDKTAGNIFDSTPRRELAAHLEQARAAGIWTALAGSVNAQTVADAMVMRPDIIAVRGAVCPNGREGTVDQQAVSRFRSAMFSNRRGLEKDH